MKILQPAAWPNPKGYSNGIEATGRVIFVAGQVGWDANEKFVSATMAGQTEQILKNICTVLSEAGGVAQHITRMTWYVVDKKRYLVEAKEIGAAYRSIMGSHYPAMSLIEVKSLLEDKALIEIEATAVIP